MARAASLTEIERIRRDGYVVAEDLLQRAPLGFVGKNNLAHASPVEGTAWSQDFLSHLLDDSREGFRSRCHHIARNLIGIEYRNFIFYKQPAHCALATRDSTREADA